jgi:hypothetical protein
VVGGRRGYPVLTMGEAQERCNARLRPVSDGPRALQDAALLCSGTDVPGPALVELIQMDLAELACMEGDELALIAALSGLLVRTFWLGFEFGKAEE